MNRLAAVVGVTILMSGCIDRAAFLCDECRKETDELANELGMAHVSTRQDILEIMKAGENSCYGNHIVLHSAGCDSAYDFARWCQHNNVGVRGVYSMEAFTQREFPVNVKKVINYRAPGKWIFGEYESGGGERNRTENISQAEHLSLPRKARKLIKAEIRGSHHRNPKR